MASIVLKTFKGGNVSPLNDAIMWQTSIPGAGIFKGCEVTAARGNILHISQGYGIIKGRFFEVYENEVSVNLAETGQTLNGRLYIHMDLSNADEPIKIMTETAETLSSLLMDQNVNYNNSSYDLELAVFKVDAGGIRNLTQVFPSVQGGAGGGGGNGAAGIMRDTAYDEGDIVTCGNAPGWAILVCTQSGTTAITEPIGYTQITKGGDMVLDGNCVFTARDLIAELDNITLLQDDISEMADEIQAVRTDLSGEIDALRSDASAIVLKLMSVTEYNALKTYDGNTIYYCYENADTHEIKRIYLGEHVIYATGVSVTYKVDSGNTIQQTASLSQDIVASAPPVTKSGYTFVGWKTDATADGSVLNSYVLQSDSAVTLYAVFKRAITIDMDSMDATLPDGAEETSKTAILYYNNGTAASEKVLIPECPYVMEDKTFCGWTINPTAAESYMPGEEYSFSNDATLYPCFVDTDYEYDDVFTTTLYFRAPASGIYEFECWGAQGGDASGTIDNVAMSATGGKGGHVKAYRKIKKGTMLYIYNGYHPQGTSTSYNRGGMGNTYASAKHIGAAGGGATYVSLNNVALNGMTNQSNQYANNKDKIILIAGGGGGAGISASTNDNVTLPLKNRFVKGPHDGGYAGGQNGQDGSSGSYGGGQTSNSYYEYDGWGCKTSTSGNSTYSGGGSGWFGGDYGMNGNSGAGGSSYVGNSPTFTFNGVKYKTVNEANNHEGHGRTHIKFMVPCTMI